MSRSFETFLSTFAVSAREADEPGVADAPAAFGLIRDQLGGITVDGGLYRVHTARSADAAERWVGAMFPEYGTRIRCVGFDWLGRQFAADLRRPVDDPPVLSFEPGSGGVFEIPTPLSEFHDRGLIEAREEALDVAFYLEWRSANPGMDQLEFSQCVGFRIPLFLGGEGLTSNLEVTDLDVYWTLSGQLWQQVRDLPPGTRIGAVRGPEQ